MKKLLCTLPLIFFFSLITLAQTKVTGKVTDNKDGAPLSGVTVQAKGANLAVQTGPDGSFSIDLPAGARILVFSFVGYAKMEVTVDASNEVAVALTADDKKLDEVVVVAYGQSDRRKLTGAVAKVDGKEFEMVPMASVDAMLQGKVAGLQSTAVSGQPGGLQQVRIRGIGSINASSAPLYVIDGVPVNSGDFTRNTTTANALAGLNPNDIDNISVLKDASAASLYGSRAANGVILITTKKGKAGKTRISFDAEGGISDVSYINDLSRPLNSDQFFELTKEGLVNAGLTDSQAEGYMNAVMGADQGYDTDWFDEVTRKGVTQQYNLSVSGGQEKTTFYLSGGYFKQEGVVIESDFRRFSANFNIKHAISNRISIGLNLNGSHSDQNTPSQAGNFRNPVIAAYFLTPWQHPYNDDGSFNIDDNEFPQIYNPVALVNYDDQQSNNTKVLGSVFGEFNILKNLRFTTKFGVDYFNIEEKTYYNPFFGDGVTRGGDFYNYYTRVFNWVWTNTLDYHHNFDEDGDFSADLKVGYEAQKSKEYNINAYGSQVPLLTSLTLPPTSSPKDAQGSGSDYSFESIFSNLQFNYKDKYFLSGSLRRDESSRFGSNNRAGTFWSVGASWNIDREGFFPDTKIVSALKLRASYGVNGNAAIGNYAWRPLYGFGADYTQLPGSAPASVGNLDLTWEQNKPFDVGIDLGLLDNRVTIIADYYIRKTDKLLQNVPLSLTSGLTSYLDNIGSMENKGFEITVNATPIVNKSFRWDVGVNFSWNKNKVTALDNGADIINGTNLIRVGEDVKTVYTFLWAGVDAETGSPLWYTDETKKETTSDITQVENAIYGSASPKGFGGFNTQLSYKGISLSAQLNFQYGNQLLNNWGFLNESDGAFFPLNQNRKEFEQRWQRPGDRTNVPQYVAGNSTNSNFTSSRYFYKGDYLRLRDLTLSYQFPANMVKSWRMEGLRVYLRGTNLWTHAFDDNITFDPEQPVNGVNDLQMLLQRTFSFGLNLDF